MKVDIVVSKNDKTRPDAFRIRKTVFMDEQGFFDQLDSIDDIAYHAAAYDGDKVIGCGRMFPESDMKYHVGRIAVLSEYRGMDIGSGIMTALENTARSDGALYLVLSAQRRARDFYVKMGYESIGENILKKGIRIYLCRKNYEKVLAVHGEDFFCY